MGVCIQAEPDWYSIISTNDDNSGMYSHEFTVWTDTILNLLVKSIIYVQCNSYMTVFITSYDKFLQYNYQYTIHGWLE